MSKPLALIVHQTTANGKREIQTEVFDPFKERGPEDTHPVLRIDEENLTWTRPVYDQPTFHQFGVLVHEKETVSVESHKICNRAHAIAVFDPGDAMQVESVCHQIDQLARRASLFLQSGLRMGAILGARNFSCDLAFHLAAWPKPEVETLLIEALLDYMADNGIPMPDEGTEKGKALIDKVVAKLKEKKAQSS